MCVDLLYGKANMKLISQYSIISIPVRNQDESLLFYCAKLGLEVRQDLTFGPGLRLLTVAAPAQRKPEIALAQPSFARTSTMEHEQSYDQRRNIPFVFATEDCQTEYRLLLERGVNFVRTPTRQMYGLEAVFVDPDHNPFTLLEASPEARQHFQLRNIWSAA